MRNDDPFHFEDMFNFVRADSFLNKEPMNLGAIETRLAMATPGPWRVKPSENGGIHRGTVQVEEDGRMIEVIAECYCGAREGHGLRNAELIAHAPEDLEALIEEVKRLRMERTVARLAASMLAEVWRKAQRRPIALPEAFKGNDHMKLYGDVIFWGITEGLIDSEGDGFTFDVFMDVWKKFVRSFAG